MCKLICWDTHKRAICNKKITSNIKSLKTHIQLNNLYFQWVLFVFVWFSFTFFEFLPPFSETSRTGSYHTSKTFFFFENGHSRKKSFCEHSWFGTHQMLKVLDIRNVVALAQINIHSRSILRLRDGMPTDASSNWLNWG